MTTKLINLKDIIHIDGLSELIYQFAKKPDKTYYSNTSILFRHLRFCTDCWLAEFGFIYDGLDFNRIVFPKILKIYKFNI